MDLEKERVHVGCQPPVQNFGFGDVVGFGVGGAFGEDVSGVLEGADVDWYKGIVDVYRRHFKFSRLASGLVFE